MKNRITFDGNEMTYHLTGEIDHHSARAARELIDSLIAQKRPSTLRLDFSEVGFMDSSGIGLIMGRYRMMQLYGGTVNVVNVPADQEKIMQLSGLGTRGIIRSQKGEAYEGT